MKAKREAGFSLVELIIVILIIIALASFAFPVFISVQERASITKDMNNLRQLAFGSQRYINDNDGAFFKSTGDPWMKRLCPDVSKTTRYISDWGVFQSPWDTRTRASGDARTPVSYGVNNYTGVITTDGLDTSKIVNPTAFIFFAAAQNSGDTVSFSGTAATPPPGVWVNRDATASGTVSGGTQQKRRRISAVCADGHVENMLWTTFIRYQSNADDPNADCRWQYLCKP
jgi:type II secretory pathway pseudopilin PulG